MPKPYVSIGGQWVPLGNVNEVEVGPSDPITTNLAAELWYDTDAVAPAESVRQWNNAWGIQAVATMKTAPVTTTANLETAVCNPLTFTLIVGRRYRLMGNVRAVIPNTAGSYVSRLQLHRDGTAISDNHANLGTAGQNYNNNPLVAYLDGDGVSHAWDIRLFGVAVLTAYTDNPTSYFVIEDVGPTSVATPIVTNPNTQEVYRTKPSANVVVTPAMGQAVVMGLTVPAAAIPVGRVCVLHYNVVVTQTTAAVFDAVAWVNGVAVMMRQGSTTGAGENINYSTYFISTGGDLPLLITINAWGGQNVTAWPSSSIMAIIHPGN